MITRLCHSHFLSPKATYVRRLVFLIIYLVLLPYTLQARSQADSLLTIYHTAKDSLTKAKLAYELVVTYSDNYELSHHYAVQGFSAIRKMQPSRATIMLANALGSDWSDHEGNPDSAIYYYSIARTAAHALKETTLEYSITGNIAEAYAGKADYPNALRYQLEALHHWEQVKDIPHILRLQKMTGDTYFFMERLPEALQYYNKVYPAIQSEHSKRAAELFHSMGLAYRDMGDAVKGETMIRRALTIFREIKDSSSLPHTLSDLAATTDNRGDHAGAITLFREALGVAETKGFTAVANIIRQNMAFVETERGNYGGAIQQYKQCLQEMRREGNTRVVQSVLNNLINLSDSLHDYKAAYRYSQELRDVEDTMSTRNYQAGIAEAETKYKTQLALYARDSLASQNRLRLSERQRAIGQRNAAVTIGIICLMSVLVVGIFIFRIRIIRARRQEEQLATRAIFEGEQAERIRIARDLHDSIGQMLAVVKMRLTSASPQTAEDLAAQRSTMTKLVDDTITEVRNISHNLMPEDLSFGVARAIENLCARMSAGSSVRVLVRIPEELYRHQFNQQFGLSLYRIVQEVLGNMMKHSGATEITLEMSESAGQVLLQITDNGKGFDTSTITASKGIGWKNIFARVNLLNGSVDVRSERISGTRIEILIPQ